MGLDRDCDYDYHYGVTIIHGGSIRERQRTLSDIVSSPDRPELAMALAMSVDDRLFVARLWHGTQTWRVLPPCFRYNEYRAEILDRILTRQEALVEYLKHKGEEDRVETNNAESSSETNAGFLLIIDTDQPLYLDRLINQTILRSRELQIHLILICPREPPPKLLSLCADNKIFIRRYNLDRGGQVEMGPNFGWRPYEIPGELLHPVRRLTMPKVRRYAEAVSIDEDDFLNIGWGN